MLDQAAGLRRRRNEAPIHCILAYFASAALTRNLAYALRSHGLTTLLVDAQGRLLADAPRNLFDWRAQLARAQLHTFPDRDALAWYAPGLQADFPGLATAARGYDALLIDVGFDTDRLALMRGARHSIVVEAAASPQDPTRAYARLKTFASAEDVDSVGLVGEPSACDRLAAACARFMAPPMARKIYSVAREDAPFAALAVRMTDEEAGLRARYKTGTPLEHGR